MRVVQTNGPGMRMGVGEVLRCQTRESVRQRLTGTHRGDGKSVRLKLMPAAKR